MITCGYYENNNTTKNTLDEIVKKNNNEIKFKETFLGKNIKNCHYNNFYKDSEVLPSKYHLPKIHTLLTNIDNNKYAISNITFNANNKKQTVQFVCINGDTLTKYEYDNPNIIIELFNNNKIQICNINGLSKYNVMTVSEMCCIDAYTSTILFFLFIYELFGTLNIVNGDKCVFLSIASSKQTTVYWNGYFMCFGYSKMCDENKQLCFKKVGHEIAHALIETCGGIIYKGESGSVNETISDFIGNCFKIYCNMKSRSIKFDWNFSDILGFNLITYSNPKSKQQPDTFKGEYWLNTLSKLDNGGIFVNSSIGKYFLYLLTNGGSGTNDNGYIYTLNDHVPIFKILALIYNSLCGYNGYNKILNICSLKDFFNVLKSNCELFVTRYKINGDVKNIINNVMSAIGISNMSINETNYDDIPFICDKSDISSDDTTNWSQNVSIADKDSIDTHLNLNDALFFSNKTNYKNNNTDKHDENDLIHPTPRQIPIEIINMCNFAKHKITITGQSIIVSDTLLCYNNTSIGVSFYLYKCVSNDFKNINIVNKKLELELEIENMFSTVVVNINYMYGANYKPNKPQTKAQTIIPQCNTINIRSVTIPLPRTNNAKLINVQILTNGSYSKLRYLTLGYC